MIGVHDKMFWTLCLIVLTGLGLSNVKQHTELLKLSKTQPLKLFYWKKCIFNEDTLESFERVMNNSTLSWKPWIRFSDCNKLLQLHWLNSSLMFKFRISFFVVLLMLKLLQITKTSWANVHHLNFSWQFWVGCLASLDSQLVSSVLYYTLCYTESVRRKEKFVGEFCSQIKIKMWA